MPSLATKIVRREESVFRTVAPPVVTLISPPTFTEVGHGEMMVKELQLSKGKIALVDDEDFDSMGRWKWTAMEVPRVIGSLWYARRCVRDPDGRQHSILLHRAILNAPPGLEVDHVDGNPLDNRRGNLRLCTRSQNRSNHRKKWAGSKSRFLGIDVELAEPRRRRRTVYTAVIRPYGHRALRCGCFDDEVVAACVRDAVARELLGEFAFGNIPLVAKGQEPASGEVIP